MTNQIAELISELEIVKGERDALKDRVDSLNRAVETQAKLYRQALSRAKWAEAKLDNQKPVAYVSKRILDDFDPNGTRIEDAHLFPKGTLHSDKEIAIYTLPKNVTIHEFLENDDD